MFAKLFEETNLSKPLIVCPVSLTLATAPNTQEVTELNWNWLPKSSAS